MASPSKRDGSSYLWFRKRVPADVREKAFDKLLVLQFPSIGNEKERTVSVAVRSHVKFSLGTRDTDVAKARAGYAIAHLEKFYCSLRNGPASLTQKQIVALSGEVYRLYVDKFSEDPGTPDLWAAFKAFNRAAAEGRLNNVPEVRTDMPNETSDAAVAFGGDLTKGVDSYPKSDNTSALEARFGWLTNWVLTTHGLSVDAPSRDRLLREVGRAATDAAWALKRNASGDYAPDPNALRFPAVTLARTSIDDLFEKWKTERQPAASTLSTWRTAKRSLIDHLGHTHVENVRDTDIVAWKDRLLASGLWPFCQVDQRLLFGGGENSVLIRREQQATCDQSGRWHQGDGS